MNTIKLIALDLDGTLTEGSSWQNLNRAMGATPQEDEYYYKLYHQGKITYPEWIQALVSIYFERGKPTRENITQNLLQYKFFPGAREAVEEFKARGIYIALISGAMDIVVEAVAQDLGIEIFAYNSKFIFDTKDSLSRVEARGEEARVKLDHLLAICGKLNLVPSQCVCVGDGSNDRLLFTVTGRGVTFDHCTSLHDCCWKRVKDWTSLVPLLCGENILT